MFHRDLFGLRLKKLRLQAKETQKELAELIGVKPNQIGEMENGRGASTFDRLVILCEHYNVSADYLLGLTDDPRPLRPCGGTSPHRGGEEEESSFQWQSCISATA